MIIMVPTKKPSVVARLYKWGAPALLLTAAYVYYVHVQRLSRCMYEVEPYATFTGTGQTGKLKRLLKLRDPVVPCVVG